jgi:2-polyprenyl-3-methyl-5-hydroxy-6-metoxy-1,4-benzoquinol methylase
MEEIAPGSILQRMYFKRRIRKKEYKTFCEIGSGNGILSEFLLKSGLAGRGYDLNKSACDNNELRNKAFIHQGSYSVKCDDVLSNPPPEKFDMIISSMVIEHLTDADVEKYFKMCKEHLNPDGRIIVFVPASQRYWGIEDEIAGHFRRYEFDDFKKIAAANTLEINDLCGLTFPLSNILFPVSNYLVKKSESSKRSLSKQEQTILSGNREVKFKTTYPTVLKIFLNEMVLYPLYLLQRIFKNHSSSMVIYCEMSM